MRAGVLFFIPVITLVLRLEPGSEETLITVFTELANQQIPSLVTLQFSCLNLVVFVYNNVCPITFKSWRSWKWATWMSLQEQTCSWAEGMQLPDQFPL